MPPPNDDPLSTTKPSDTADANRPAGGTARLSGGAKTPRKVQWAADTQHHSIPPTVPENDGDVSTHALDEHGLDPTAFQNLTHALERHRSTSASPSAPLHIPSPSTTSASSSVYPSPHQVPGENFIDPDERAGLPGRNLELYSQAKATKVVQAHKSGFFGHFRHHKKHRRVSSSDIEADADNAASSTPLRALGSGVLSTLLTLYDHPRTPSTPGGSELPTPSRPSLDDSSKPSFASDRRGFSFDTLSRTFTSPSVGSLASTAVGAPSTSRNRTFNFTLPGALGDSRPAQSRSAAGVFGPLIASTGNIAGAAAPASATIAPNVKRPGYHLSRYSLESNILCTTSAD
ncbi:hypothetical protein EW146_g6228 [Bondarzewia mesenterica]|uniref:Uncharacterized protein n=1 Tax=Bondarzewia mesenterica TaxID=1095465 RepID=A0A4S4LP80_9AGAM|nr:hypothetical protein EW146_g6228 [Bondarzewia mesenterica]